MAMAEARYLVSPARVFARPTADQIWLGPCQQAALSQLSRNSRVRLLIGPASSGKSTLLNHLAAQLGADDVVLHCRGPKDTALAVLSNLLIGADLAPWELSEIEQRNLFTVFVQQRRAQGRRIVLVIDDAHLYEPAAWEEIERLMAFKVSKRGVIELLLAGPPALAQSFDSSRVGLDPKDVDTHSLFAPSDEDLASYIAWRLARFEMADLVTPVAAQMIARLSGGRYSAVDVLCQLSLLLLRQLGRDRVDEGVARQATAMLVARQGAKLEEKSTAETDEPPEVPPQGYLLISRGGKMYNRATLGQRTLLGRSEHNDVWLPSPYLSRHHAAIVGTPQGYYVVDLNSTNGLQLNGRQVERAVLCDQDVLTIGPFRMKVQIPEWLAQGNPLPESPSLADTALMPTLEPRSPAAIRAVK
jgi:type II secretory pathway predicted ATPase ExeA